MLMHRVAKFVLILLHVTVEHAQSKPAMLPTKTVLTALRGGALPTATKGAVGSLNVRSRGGGATEAPLDDRRLGSRMTTRGE